MTTLPYELAFHHVGGCECDNGTEHGTPVHDWDCQYVKCLLEECLCEQDALDRLEASHEGYLASAEYEQEDDR